MIATAHSTYADGARFPERTTTVVGKTLGHYEIIEPLGAGGIGAEFGGGGWLFSPAEFASPKCSADRQEAD